MTQTEFLLDMLGYYTVDPVARRCSRQGESGCVYSPVTAKKPTSEGCAIGRKLTPELALELDKISASGMSGGSINNTELFDLIPEELQALGQSFLTKCQLFHDNADHWTPSELSYEGKNRLENYIIRYSLDREQFTKYL